MASHETTDARQARLDDKVQDRVELRLYVAGQSANSLAAIANLRRVCEQYLPGRYDIELIDLVEPARPGRRDRCRTDAGAPAARTHTQDHRRPFGHRKGPGRAADSRRRRG